MPTDHGVVIFGVGEGNTYVKSSTLGSYAADHVGSIEFWGFSLADQ